jgi:hypothetical protein
MIEPDNLEDIIEIRDDQIDVKEVMRQIRANLQKRREAAAAQGVDLDTFVARLYREDHGHFDATVYYNLRRANATADRITVSRYVSPRSTPVIGGLIQRMRGALHDLVIYYVNMLGSKQTLFNEAIVYMQNSLIEGLDKEADRTAAELATLREEVQQLRAELTELKAHQELK